MFDNVSRLSRQAIGTSVTTPRLEDFDFRKTIDSSVLSSLSALDLVNSDTIEKLQKVYTDAIKQSDKKTMMVSKKQLDDIKKLSQLKNSKDIKLLDTYLSEGAENMSFKDIKNFTSLLKQIDEHTKSLTDTLSISINDFTDKVVDMMDSSNTGDAKLSMAKEFAKALAETDIVNQSPEYTKLLEFLSTNTKLNDEKSKQLENLILDVRDEIKNVDRINDLVEVLQDTSSSEQEQSDALDGILLQLQASGKQLEQLDILKEVVASNKSMEDKLAELKPAISSINNTSMQTRMLYTLQQLEHRPSALPATNTGVMAPLALKKLLGKFKDSSPMSKDDMKMAAGQYILSKIPLLGNALMTMDGASGGLISSNLATAGLLGGGWALKKGGGVLKGAARATWNKARGVPNIRTASPSMRSGFTNTGSSLKNVAKGLKGKAKFAALAFGAYEGYKWLSGGDNNQQDYQQPYPAIDPITGMPLNQNGMNQSYAGAGEEENGVMAHVLNNADGYLTGGLAVNSMARNATATVNGVKSVGQGAKGLIDGTKSVTSIAKSATNVAKMAKGGVGGGLLSAGLGAISYATAENSAERKAAVGETVGAIAGTVIGTLIPIPGMSIVGGWLGSKVGGWISGWFTDPQDNIPDEVKDNGKLAEAVYIDGMLASPELDLSSSDRKKLKEYQAECLKDEDAMEEYIDHTIGNVPDTKKYELMTTFLNSDPSFAQQHPVIFEGIKSYIEKYKQPEATPVQETVSSKSIESTIKQVTPESTTSAVGATATAGLFQNLSGNANDPKSSPMLDLISAINPVAGIAKLFSTNSDSNTASSIIDAINPFSGLASGISSIAKFVTGGNDSQVKELIDRINNSSELSKEIKDKLIQTATSTNSVEKTKELAEKLVSSSTGVFSETKGEPGGIVNVDPSLAKTFNVQAESVSISTNKDGSVSIVGTTTGTEYNKQDALVVTDISSVGASPFNSNVFNSNLPAELVNNNPGGLKSLSGSLLSFPTMMEGANSLSGFLKKTSIGDTFSNIASTFLLGTSDASNLIQKFGNVFTGNDEQATSLASTIINNKGYGDLLKAVPVVGGALQLVSSITNGMSLLDSTSFSRASTSSLISSLNSVEGFGIPSNMSSTTSASMLNGGSSSLVNSFPNVTNNDILSFLSSPNGQQFSHLTNSSNLLKDAITLYSTNPSFRKAFASYMVSKNQGQVSNIATNPLAVIPQNSSLSVMNSNDLMSSSNVAGSSLSLLSSESGTASIIQTKDVATKIVELISKVEQLRVQQSAGGSLGSSVPIQIQERKPSIAQDNNIGTHSEDLMLVLTNKGLLSM